LKLERTSTGALCHLNVLGTWPFLSARFGECNALSFSEIVVIHAFKTVGMKEQVLVGANVNESKTFVSKSLNRAFSHSQILKSVEQRLSELNLSNTNRRAIIIAANHKS
jgi:hypothetical protein